MAAPGLIVVHSIYVAQQCEPKPHPSQVHMRRCQGAELLYSNVRILQQERCMFFVGTVQIHSKSPMNFVPITPIIPTIPFEDHDVNKKPKFESKYQISGCVRITQK